MVEEELLNSTLDVHSFAALPADERFDSSEAAKHVSGPAMRTGDATDFHRREFHQPCTGASDGNRIDHSAARVALDLHHIAALQNYQAAIAIRASGEFVRQDEIPAFVLGHIE
jgi:hypothetical protein